MKNRISIMLCISLLLMGYFGSSDGLAVMSIDLGSEWMKIGIVSPGVPMEIVLNKESKRKTPIAISFRDDDREFGENAITLGTRFPEKVYKFIVELIGKQIDNPVVEKFRQRFPYYNITKEKNRNTVVFQHDETTQFTIEELLSMILEKAKELAQDFAGQRVTDAVITVPAFFNQAERRAVKVAAELAGIKVLQLMSDNAAVALNYGIFRRKDFNSTMQRIMFFDMGSGSTEITVVGYQIVKTKEKGYAEDNPQLSILGVGYDRTLGGLELTLRLQKHFAEKFNEKKLTKTDVFQNPRAMAKLLKEAERVKVVLSANADHTAQVESLLDDKDFKLPVSRMELEELGADLFSKIGPLIEKCLKSAEVTMDDIDQVILVGAATRVPRVQEEILKATKKAELGKNLNTDEAAAMGAVYQAAHLSLGFKVKRFIVKEAVLFPIQVSFERELDEKEGSGVKHVSRTLFGTLNPFPQKKVMTFNRHVKDFTIAVSYGDLGFLPLNERVFFGSQSIENISLNGVAAALAKHNDDHSEYKGVKAHFKLDESGILTLDQVDSVFEMTVPDVTEPDDPESTLSKLGSTISKLFSGMGSADDKPENSEETEKSDEPAPEEKSTSKAPVASEMPDNSTTSKNDSTESNQDLKNATLTSEKMKTVVVKEPIIAEETILDLKSFDEDSLKASRDKLKTFYEVERAKHELEEAHNALESFLVETRDKLYQPEYEDVTTEEERNEINEKLSEVSNWLDEDSYGAKTKDYRSKLSSLKSATREMFERVKEHRDRPEAFAALKEVLNGSEFFLSRALNISEDEQYFTEIEFTALQTLINNTKKWKEDKEKEQAALPLYQTPVVTVRAIAEKIAELDREVKYLINKARTSKPKPKPKSEEGSPSATSEEEKNTQENETVIEGVVIEGNGTMHASNSSDEDGLGETLQLPGSNGEEVQPDTTDFSSTTDQPESSKDDTADVQPESDDSEVSSTSKPASTKTDIHGEL